MTLLMRVLFAALGSVLAAAGLLIGFANVLTNWAIPGIIGSGVLVFLGAALVARAAFSATKD